MDAATLIRIGIASSLRDSQMELGHQAFRKAAEAQIQMESVLSQSVQQDQAKLRTSGSVGTIVNVIA